MSVLSETYRSRSLSSRRSASLHRKRNLRQEFSWYGDDCYSPLNTLRSSVRSQTLSLRGGGGLNGGKPSAIDPELRDARKQGNRYNIAMNLNALLDFPMTDSATLKREKKQKSHDYSLATMHRSLSSPYSLHHSSRSRMTPVVRSADTSGRKSVITVARESVPAADSFRRSTLKSETKTLERLDDAYAIRSVKASSVENIPQVIKQRSASDEGYIIRSVTPNSRIRESVETEYIGDETVSFDLQLIGTDSLLRSKTSRTTTRQSSDYNLANSGDMTDGTTRIRESGWNDKAENDGPSISMTINETMTMDYYQPEETKGSLNRNSLPKQLKGSRPTNSKATTRQSEKDRDKTRPRPKSSLLPSAAPALAAAQETESRQGHRKRQKSASAARQPERREPDRASRLHDSSLQRHWSIDQVDQAGKVKNLDVLRQNRPRNLRRDSDGGFDDGDFIFRENRDISSPAWKRNSFDRNVVGQSTRSSNAVRQPIKGFSEHDVEIRRQTPIVRSASIGQQLPMSSRQTLFQRKELIPVETTTTINYNNTFNNQCSDDEYQSQIEITRGLSGERRARSPIALPPLQPRIPTALTSTYVRQIMKDAPDGSFRQRMDVHREEEEGKFSGQLHANRSGGGGGASQQDSMADLLNVDLVSEKVDMKLIDGVAQLVVTVTCERFVPIHGSVDLYKKTSVVVRRCIDVDLTVTEERKKIYDEVMKNRLPSGKLSSKDTFELYIAFMEVAELHPSPGLDQEQLWIDRKVDEEKVGKYTSLEKKLSEGSEFTAKHFGTGQHGIAEARSRFMRNRNAASSPASTYPLSQSYLTSPTRSYSNYYGGSNYATVLPSSGYQSTSLRWKSGNDTSSIPVQCYDTEVGRRHEDQALNAGGRDEQFAEEMVHRRDDRSFVGHSMQPDGGEQLQGNKDSSVKISGQEARRGNADELLLGGVSWSKSTVSNEYGGDVGLSSRPTTIKEPEQADRSLYRSQERIREIGEEPGYQVLSGEGKQGGEYSLYEELKPKEEIESRYSEPMHRESNGQHSRLSGFTRYGKTSLIC